jgi:hypothetical protein
MRRPCVSLGPRRNMPLGVQGSVCAAAILSRSCPLWVKTRHDTLKSPCPLYPRKRTFLSAVSMSALCHKRTSAVLIDQLVGAVLPTYSREDAKSCNAIPAKRISAPPIRQKRSTQRAIRWPGKGFLWHCFWACCKLRRQTQALPNIPFDGMICN